MDQLDIPLTKLPGKKKRGRPRKYADDDESKKARVDARRMARHAARQALLQNPAEIRRRATQLRLDRLAPPGPDLDVRDDDLKEIAGSHPNVAEALQYVRDVLTERVPACTWVRMACERHERDVARIESDGLAAIPLTRASRNGRCEPSRSFAKYAAANAGQLFPVPAVAEISGGFHVRLGWIR